MRVIQLISLLSSLSPEQLVEFKCVVQTTGNIGLFRGKEMVAVVDMQEREIVWKEERKG